MAEHGKSLNQIFISYRREDSAAITGRIYDRLLQRFGRDTIFKDVDSIPLGVNFRKHIDSIVSECAVVLVVIGDKWMGATDSMGRGRLNDPRDFVRIEIESALRRGIPVIPLLVHNAELPGERILPESLRELADRNGMSIGHDPHFHGDINRLISNLEAILEVCEQKEDPAARRAAPPHEYQETPARTGQTAPALAAHAPAQAPAPPRARFHGNGRVGLKMYLLAVAGSFLSLLVSIPAAVISENYIRSDYSSSGNVYTYSGTFSILFMTQTLLLALGLFCFSLGRMRPLCKSRLATAASALPLLIFVIGLLFSLPDLFRILDPSFPVHFTIFLLTALKIPAYAFAGAHLGAQSALHRQARKVVA
jgi:TIR domain